MKESTPAYRNSALPVAERVEDLIGRMTLEEKIGQMCQYCYPDKPQASENSEAEDDATPLYDAATLADLDDKIRRGEIGSFLAIYDVALANQLQALAASSRLGIPLLFGVDAIHGHGLYPGATVFPAPIALAATWDTQVARQVARATALEMRATNAHWAFSPNLDVARDGRWGRFGETFGEDPYLVSRMGEAMIEGYQYGAGPADSVLACAKHFVAGGEPFSGLNFGSMDLSERALRETHLPPFNVAINAGAGTVMMAHNEVNAVPCHASHYLMQDILRDELGFQGFIVSDWTDIARLHTLHRVAESFEDACRLAVNAGLDMHMHGPFFHESICSLVRAGRITVERIDASVRAILRAKFRLGLFEAHSVDSKSLSSVLGSTTHRDLALKAAQKAIVLLKNDGDLLPLKIGSRILLTGPASNAHTILGDWVCPPQDDSCVTLLEGLKRCLPPESTLTYCESGNIFNISNDSIAACVRAAAEADIIIVAVGENPLRYEGELVTEGENVDRPDLDLPGRQEELIRALYATGTPVVGVLVNGRPQSCAWTAEHVPALVEAFHPGVQGGMALAQVLVGDINPSGRMPYTVPRSAGHLKQVYNHKPSNYFRKFTHAKTEPLFAFGHGLSYTHFAYSDLQVKPSNTPDTLFEVSVIVSNQGPRDGEEVVILYLTDCYASVTRPVREVAAFQRIPLSCDQSRTLTFSLSHRDLVLLDAELRLVVEPGTFLVRIGSLEAEFRLD